MDFNNTSDTTKMMRKKPDSIESDEIDRLESEKNPLDFLNNEKSDVGNEFAYNKKTSSEDLTKSISHFDSEEIDHVANFDVLNNGVHSPEKLYVEKNDFSNNDDVNDFRTSNATNFSDLKKKDFEHNTTDKDVYEVTNENLKSFVNDFLSREIENCDESLFTSKNDASNISATFDDNQFTTYIQEETHHVRKPDEENSNVSKSEPAADFLKINSDKPNEFITENFIQSSNVENIEPEKLSCNLMPRSEKENYQSCFRAEDTMKFIGDKCSEIGPKDFFSKYGLDTWFYPERLNPTVEAFIYWRDPKLSGIVFGSSLVLLLSMAYFSLISVIANTSLVILVCAIVFRIYKDILQAVQKSPQTHPYSVFLSRDIKLPQEKVNELVDVVILHINACLGELRRLFLVEDMIESLKFALVLWVLTYVGSWFNGLTLVIIGFVALFTLPKVYENNKVQIDQNLALARVKLEEITNKIKDALPAPLRRKLPEKKEQ